MSSLPKPFYTPEHYLELEYAADYKSEYLSGQIFAMAGASPRHVTITVNVASELRSQMRGRPCQTFSSDLRVRVSATGLFTYPDVVAVCGELRFDELDENALINPAVIVEVLSKSTETYDRGEKFIHYRKIGAMTDYILISQETARVEHFVRQPDNQWLLSEADTLQDRIILSSIGCELALAEIYEKVAFPSEREAV